VRERFAVVLLASPRGHPVKKVGVSIQKVIEDVFSANVGADPIAHGSSLN